MKKGQESLFKEIRRFRKDSDLCMKCGFCISACPIYREELVESAVARGKNALVRGLLNGEVEFTPELAERLDKCTLCKTCTENCPANVNIPAVIIAARADQFRKRGTAFPYSAVYRSLLPRRVLFGRIVKAVGLAQKTFSHGGEGTLRHLPLFLSGMGKGRHIPQVAKQFLREALP
ncbi:MAG: (Fe-S)-binding protein, partial [Dehalococcoidales bacterium]|nr:(Fe-S)-binding protein [Dehalococcoidales bacterium]